MADKLSMQFVEKPECGALVATAKGQVDVFSYKDFATTLETHAKDSAMPNLIVDLSGVEYVGSSGWSVLFVQSDSVDKKGGALIICAMSDRVRRSLDLIMPKKRMIRIADSLDEAMQMLGAARPA